MRFVFFCALLFARLGCAINPDCYNRFTGLYKADIYSIRVNLVNGSLMAHVQDGPEFELVPSEGETTEEAKFSVRFFPGFQVLFRMENGTIQSVDITTPYYATYRAFPIRPESEVSTDSASHSLES